MIDRDHVTAHWYQSVWFLLFLIFVVLGPFAIPLVWRSPALSRRTKIVLTATALAYTVFAVLALADAVRTAIDVMDGSDLP